MRANTYSIVLMLLWPPGVGTGVMADSCAGGSHCSLSRTSSVADNVFKVGSGLLVKEGEEVAGNSPRSRRRCPFVIGVAGGTGPTSLSVHARSDQIRIDQITSDQGDQGHVTIQSSSILICQQAAGYQQD